MEKSYNPKEIEQRLYVSWEGSGYFKPSSPQKNPYCIMLPPPNVTGSLHMGHAFQDTLMDSLVRFNRMNDHNVLWQCGCDHAGIATQIVVERQLELNGKSRHDMGRDAFMQAAWDWKAESGGHNFAATKANGLFNGLESRKIHFRRSTFSECDGSFCATVPRGPDLQG